MTRLASGRVRRHRIIDVIEPGRDGGDSSAAPASVAGQWSRRWRRPRRCRQRPGWSRPVAG